jgi:nucleoside-diphosphate-sugar epimerase
MLLVTGASGFLGQNILKGMGGKKDIRILTTDLEKTKKIYPGYEIVRGDVTDPRTLDGIGKGVDTIIHLAGLVSYTKPRGELFRVNVEGTRNVLEACPNAKKIMFSSSVAVYGDVRGIADEDYRNKPKTPYGESKREAENIIRDSNLESVIFRIAPVYGKGSPYWFKNLGLLEKGFPIPKTTNLTHVVHVSNVVQAFRLGLKKDSKGTYNIADKKPVKFVDFAESLVRLLGNEPKTMPMWLVKSLARMKGMKPYMDTLTMNRNYNVSKAIRELGYKPRTDFKEELKKMVEWYKKSKTI